MFLTLDEAQQLPPADHDWLVKGLLPRRTINIFIGGSTMGKTPLIYQLGLAVASGQPWLGFPTETGRVLYFDAETPYHRLRQMVRTLPQVVQAGPDTGKNFAVWPLQVNDLSADDAAALSHYDPFTLIDRYIAKYQPDLVIVDPIRLFWPTISRGNHEAAEIYRGLLERCRGIQGNKGTGFLLIHHKRKASRDGNYSAPGLRENPVSWMEEAEGALALINHSYLRLGMEAIEGERDCYLLNGMNKDEGSFREPIFIKRQYRNDEPFGYERTAAIATNKDKLILDELEDEFGVDEVIAVTSKSKSQTYKILGRLEEAGFIQSNGRYNKRWAKISDLPQEV